MCVAVNEGLIGQTRNIQWAHTNCSVLWHWAACTASSSIRLAESGVTCMSSSYTTIDLANVVTSIAFAEAGVWRSGSRIVASLTSLDRTMFKSHTRKLSIILQR